MAYQHKHIIVSITLVCVAISLYLSACAVVITVEAARSLELYVQSDTTFSTCCRYLIENDYVIMDADQRNRFIRAYKEVNNNMTWFHLNLSDTVESAINIDVTAKYIYKDQPRPDEDRFYLNNMDEIELSAILDVMLDDIREMAKPYWLPKGYDRPPCFVPLDLPPDFITIPRVRPPPTLEAIPLSLLKTHPALEYSDGA